MNFRAHIYCTQKITGSKDPYLLFGSLFPDFHCTGVFPQGFDSKWKELIQYLNKNNPAFENIGIGMTLHEIPIGVDRFAHGTSQRIGYAFQFIGELREDAVNLFGDDHWTLLMTHFAVEYAMDYAVIKKHPEVEKTIKTVFDEIDEYKVISALSGFYSIDEPKVREAFEDFKALTLEYDYSTFEGLGKQWAAIMETTTGKKGDARAIARYIEKAYNLIEPTVDEFLEYCIAQCKKDFEKLFPNFGA